MYIRSTIGYKHAQMNIPPNRKPWGTEIADRTSLGGGPQSSPSDVCRRDNARESEIRPFARRLPSTRRQKTTTNSVTELSCTALCVVQPQEEDNKFRDGFVTVTRNCYNLPGNGPVPLCNEYLGLEWCIYCLILLYSRQVLSGS